MDLELEFVRSCLSSAFTDTLPEMFTREDMALISDGVPAGHVWNIFTNKLATHFFSYHRKGYHLGSLGLFQCRPLYRDDNETITITFTDSSPPVNNNFGHQTNSAQFEEIFVVSCDAEGRIAESNDAFLKRALKFFLPVLQYRWEKRNSSLQSLKKLWKGCESTLSVLTDLARDQDDASDSLSGVLRSGRNPESSRASMYYPMTASHK